MVGRLVYKSRLFWALLVAVIVLVGCRDRNGGDSVPSEPAPTVTPIVEVAGIETFTPTPPPPVPEPTATEVPTLVPTDTPAIALAKTNVQANLRAGPGVVYGLVGFLAEGTEVVPVSRTANRLWLKLETGNWIFAYLVDDAPTELPVETNIPAPPPRLPLLLHRRRQKFRLRQLLPLLPHRCLCLEIGLCRFTETKAS